MRVCMDANYFAEIIESNANPLRDADNNEIPHCRERTLQFLEENKAKVVIPCVVLGEVLMISTVPNDRLLEELQRNVQFVVAPYDARAAAVHAEVERPQISTGDKWAGRNMSNVSAARAKADRQMLATAVVHRADFVFTSDNGVRTDAARYGLKTLCASEVSYHDQCDLFSEADAAVDADSEILR